MVTSDRHGNGRSDRSEDGHDEREFAADALALKDATGTGRAALVSLSLSLGAQRALPLVAERPARVDGAVFIRSAVPFGRPVTGRGTQPTRVEAGPRRKSRSRTRCVRDYRYRRKGPTPGRPLPPAGEDWS